MDLNWQNCRSVTVVLTSDYPHTRLATFSASVCQLIKYTVTPKKLDHQFIAVTLSNSMTTAVLLNGIWRNLNF